MSNSASISYYKAIWYRLIETQSKGQICLYHKCQAALVILSPLRSDLDVRVYYSILYRMKKYPLTWMSQSGLSATNSYQ